MQVLIGDDYAPVRSSARSILESDGHQVLEAADGAEVLDRLRHDHVDVLVLDLHMPRCNGVEVLRALEFPPPHVIVLSAFELFSLDEVQNEFGARIHRILRKPVAPADLLAAVAAARS
ncbi:MAG: response regulator transcription factor [Gemmatimonadales bacterium]